MTNPPNNLQPAIQQVYADHRRIVKEKNRQINALQAEKGELQRALQAKTAEVVKAKMQAKGVLDDAIYAHESRTPAANLVEQMEAAYKSADSEMAPADGDTLIVWKGRDWWEVGVKIPGRPLDERLARVLHRPSPARPEGAEEIEAYMRELVASHPEDHYGKLADHLASRGVLPPLTDKSEPSRGVRVTGAES